MNHALYDGAGRVQLLHFLLRVKDHQAPAVKKLSTGLRNAKK
jgi:hypothetical protein